MSRLSIVFIHGVGKAQTREKWLDPLLRTLEGLGLPLPEEGRDRIVEPNYVSQMKLRAETEMPKVTWRAPEGSIHEANALAFAVEADRLARAVHGHQGTPTAGFAGVPGWIRDPGADVGSRTILAEAGSYKNDGRTKASAVKAVLRSMPTEGPMIVIGYSLGSVIAVDLLRRLRGDATIELLITIGSPLGLDGFGDRDVNGKFPYDRVRRWINVYDPNDLVTGGRGAGKRFFDALDVPVNCSRWNRGPGSWHDVRAYTSQPAVACAFAVGMRAGLGQPDPEVSKHPKRRDELSRQLAAWTPLLLQYAYLLAVSAGFAGNDWRKKVHFDQARLVAAGRTTDRIAEMVAAGQLPEGSALAETDFSRDALRLVGRTMSLDEVIPYLVSFANDVPIAPFQFELSQAHTIRALERLTTATLTGRFAHSRAEIAKLVAQAARTGRDAVAREKNDNRWLLLVGAAALAATGVGLAAAVPAGLAGAAAVTATLAAFGPGGMVGGIATIAALTGSGGAFLAGGVASSGSRRVAGEAARVAQIAAETLWTQPAEVIRSTLATLLGVLEAQRLLDLEIGLGPVTHLIAESRARTSAELALHRRLCPDGAAKAELQAKEALFEKAIAWVLNPARKWPTDAKVLEPGP